MQFFVIVLAFFLTNLETFSAISSTGISFEILSHLLTSLLAFVFIYQLSFEVGHMIGDRLMK